jgi:succinate dehydrogenase/fumarate reductase flavoprotein subunit
MRRAFLEGPGVEGWAFYGTLANTGDGIEMAMRAGAALAKAGKAASRLIAAVPLRRNGMKIGIITDSVGSPNSIVIDNNGNRFAAETLITTDPSRYFFYKEAIKFDILKLDYPRYPSWMVFDETFRTKRTLTAMGISTAGYGIVPWTADNMDAINRGWILKADTLEELAGKIKAHKENRNLMDPAALVATVAKFNEACAKGKDEQFERRANTLAPVDKPPYYALPLYAGGPNTKGGIAANAAREALDWNGKPIPRLYTAGEISSALKFVYQGGGNLTECIVFGRIAGQNAAKQKPWAQGPMRSVDL